MHTVELLEQAINLAEQRGFVVRQDWLSGSTAGACEFKGRRWLLIDLALSPREQLDLVLDALKKFPPQAPSVATSQLHSVLPSRKAA
jgi:hypothetical protein